MIACDKTISAMDFVSTNVVNTVSTKVPTNSGSIKVRYKIDFYISHSFISDHNSIDNYYYLLSLCKTKKEIAVPAT